MYPPQGNDLPQLFGIKTVKAHIGGDFYYNGKQKSMLLIVAQPPSKGTVRRWHDAAAWATSEGVGEGEARAREGGGEGDSSEGRSSQRRERGRRKRRL